MLCRKSLAKLTHSHLSLKACRLYATIRIIFKMVKKAFLSVAASAKDLQVSRDCFAFFMIKGNDMIYLERDPALIF